MISRLNLLRNVKGWTSDEKAMSNRFTTAHLLDLGYAIEGNQAVRVSKGKDSSPCGKKTGNPVVLEPAQKVDNIVFNITPIGKPRMTQRDRWKKRPAVVRYHAFKDELNRQARLAGFVMPDTYRAIFVIPFPQSYSKSKCLELNGQPHKLKPDKDNIEKGILDSLMTQDCSVWDSRTTKVWGYEGKIIIEAL